MNKKRAKLSKSIVIFLTILGIFISLIILNLFLFSSLDTEDTGFRVDGGQTVEVDVHENCKMVENKLARDIFIGTKTLAEWNSFLNNKPFGIKIFECQSFNVRALWNFNEGSGNTIYDDSENNININRVKYSQAPSWYTGGLYFNPARLRAYHSSAFKWKDSDTVQIDVTFRLTGSVPSGIPEGNRVFCGNWASYSNWWVGTSGNSGKLEFSVSGTSGGDALVGTTNVYDGKWHTAKFVYSNKVLRIYLDGNLQSSKTAATSGDIGQTFLDFGWHDVTPLGQSWDHYAPRNCYLDKIRIIEGGTDI